MGYQQTDTFGYKLFSGPYTWLEEKIIQIEVDGWGMLTAPNQSYEVLRVKEFNSMLRIYEIGGDTIQHLLDTSYLYKYYAKGVGEPVVVATMDSVWSGIQYFTYVANEATSVTSIQPDIIMSMYPNPADDFVWLNIHVAGNTMLSIHDLSGREFYRDSYSVHGHHDNNIKIDVASLPPGVYLLRMQNAEKNILHTEKLLKK